MSIVRRIGILDFAQQRKRRGKPPAHLFLSSMINWEERRKKKKGCDGNARGHRLFNEMKGKRGKRAAEPTSDRTLA